MAWSYQGEGVGGSGAFTTTDTSNADGFYAIAAIKGEANGVAITGLRPPGTSIPGNNGYPVDGLVGRRLRTFPAWLRLRARRRDIRQSVLRRPFRPPDDYAFFSDGETERASRGEVHGDDRH